MSIEKDKFSDSLPLSRKEKKELKRKARKDPWRDVPVTPSYYEDDKGRIKVLKHPKAQYRSHYIPVKQTPNLYGYDTVKNNRAESKRTRFGRRVNTRMMILQRIPEEVKIPVKVKKDGKMVDDKLRVKTMRMIRVFHKRTF